MSRTVPWQDGRRAWERLNGWHKWAPSMMADLASNRPDDYVQQRVKKALADVNLVRSLLNQAEIGVVRGARVAGLSWSEIGAYFSMTRQAAWERWHDVDGSDTAP